MERMYGGVCIDCAPHECGHGDFRFLPTPEKQREWLDVHHDQGHRAMIADWPVHDSLRMTIAGAVLGFVEAVVKAAGDFGAFGDLAPAPDWKEHAAHYYHHEDMELPEIAFSVGRHVDTVAAYLATLPEGDAGESAE